MINEHYTASRRKTAAQTKQYMYTVYFPRFTTINIENKRRFYACLEVAFRNLTVKPERFISAEKIIIPLSRRCQCARSGKFAVPSAH